MRTTALLAVSVVLAAAWAGASADTVTVNKIPYPDVRVTDADDCAIVFEIRGRSVERPLSQVSLINLMGRADFNRAEQLAKEGKAAGAVAAYDAAFDRADAEWLRRLIRYRRLRVLDATGAVGRAVADWLKIVDENPGSRSAVAMAPAKVGKRGSAANAAAIKLLEGRLKTKDVALLARVKQLLAALYAAEGDSGKAAMLNGSGGGPAPQPGGTPAGPAAPVVVASGVAGQLKQAADQIAAGRYAEAADAIKARLRRYSAEDLGTALLLRGRALQLLAAQRGAEGRALLAEAGLCFMRVVANMEGMPEAAEALFRAGEVCAALGNRVAAQNAWRLLVSRYGDSPWAAKARKALGG